MSAGGIRAGRAFVEIGANSAPLQAAMRRVRAQLAGFGSRLTALGGGLVAGGASILGAMAWPLQLAANLEKAETKFKTLLGSTEAAKAIMQELEQFAASTPFQFETLSAAATSLLAFGTEAGDVTDELRMLGDVASGVGIPLGELAEIYGKARVQGRLFMEDINRLQGRGINVTAEFAKQFGVAEQEIRSMVSNGEVGFANLEQALKSMTSSGGDFAGGMEAQSQTLLGVWSTLKDNVVAAIRPLGEALLPIVKGAATALTTAAQVFGGFIEKNKQLAIAIAGTGVAVVSLGATLAATGVAVVAFASVVSAAITVFSLASTVIGTVGAVIGALGWPVVLPVVAAIGILSAVFIGLTAAFVAFAAESGLITSALGFIRTAFEELLETVNQTMGGVSDALQAGEYQLAMRILWQGLKVAALQASRQLATAFDWIFHNLYNIVEGFFVYLLEQTYKVFSSIPGIMQAAITGGGNFAKLLADAMTGELNVSNLFDDAIEDAESELKRLRDEAAKLGDKQQPEKTVDAQADEIVEAQADAATASRETAEQGRQAAKEISDAQAAYEKAYNAAKNPPKPPEFEQQSAGTFNVSTIAQQLSALNENDEQLRAAKRTADATERIAEQTEEGAAFA